MKNVKYIFIKRILSAIFIIVLVAQTSCDQGMPGEYEPKAPHLVIENKEVSVSTEKLLSIPVKSGAAWTVVSSESWCVSAQPYYAGSTDLKCNLSSNRGNAPRTCTLTITSVTATATLTETVTVTQAVDSSPEISLDKVMLNADGEAGSLTVKVTHNYGVNVSSENDWLHCPPTIATVGNDLVTVDYTFSFDRNDEGARVGTISFTSTQDGLEAPVILTVNQAPNIPTVTSFFDNFEYVTANGSPLDQSVNEWSIQQDNLTIPLAFKSFNNTFKAMLCFSGGSIFVETYAIMPPFDVKNSVNKMFSYRWGVGNANSNPGDETMQIVYSTDYKADAFTATWNFLADGTLQKGGITALSLKEVPLTDIENLDRVTIAFRYRGKMTAYRIDDVKFE